MSKGDGWKVIGHDDAKAQLQQAIRTGRVGHAYLITGPSGIGKTTFALEFARALNCLERQDGTACGHCESCRRIARESDRRSHPDIIVADMEWQANVLGGRTADDSRSRQRFSIDSVRWLRQDIASRPVLGRWKIQIVDGADQLSDVAPDALLKTLEEPPGSALIILIAESYEAMPETIRSRCRHVPLSLVDSPVISAELIAMGALAEQAELIVSIARGRAGLAFELRQSPNLLEEMESEFRDALENMRDPLGRLRIVGPMASHHTRERDRTFRFLEACTLLWRDALLLKAGLQGTSGFPGVLADLAAYANDLSEQEILQALRATRRAVEDLERNFQARIALLAMTQQWPR